MVTIDDAREVTREIVKQLRPFSVVIFGSVANHGTGNDLDILVILDGDDNSMISERASLDRCVKKFYRRFAIDPIAMSHKKFISHYTSGSYFLRAVLKNGRALYMKNADSTWLNQAHDELDTAIYLFKGGFFRGACYHAQQALEKYIKSLLLKKGWELEKIHSIARLHALAIDYKVKLPLNDDDVMFVDSIYRGRYPAESGLLPMGNPSKEDAERAVRIAKNIVKIVKKKSG